MMGSVMPQSIQEETPSGNIRTGSEGNLHIGFGPHRLKLKDESNQFGRNTVGRADEDGIEVDPVLPASPGTIEPPGHGERTFRLHKVSDAVLSFGRYRGT
jgi:hypothetical protein